MAIVTRRYQCNSGPFAAAFLAKHLPAGSSPSVMGDRPVKMLDIDVEGTVTNVREDLDEIMKLFGFSFVSEDPATSLENVVADANRIGNLLFDGSTQVSLGVVADGKFLKRDGASIVGASAGAGLVQTKFKELTADTSTTSTTWVTLLSQSITTGANKLCVLMTCGVSKTGGGTPMGDFRISIDGTPLRGTGTELMANPTSASLMVCKTVTAAAHTVLLEWQTSTSTAQIRPATSPANEHCSLFIQELAV